MIDNFNEILKEAGKKSLIRAALTSKQTNTALILREGSEVKNFTGKEIDNFLKRKYPDIDVDNLKNYLQDQKKKCV